MQALALLRDGVRQDRLVRAVSAISVGERTRETRLLEPFPHTTRFSKPAAREALHAPTAREDDFGETTRSDS